MLRSNKTICSSTIENAIENLFSEGGAEHAYSKQLPGWEVEGISNFYGIHLAIWQLRPDDLQAKYPLNTQEQRANFLAWCVVHGQFEYKALLETHTFWNELLIPAVLHDTEWSQGISRLIQLVIRGRADLMIEPNLATSEAQEDALAWMYAKGGWKELGVIAEKIPTWQRSFLIGSSNLIHSPLSKIIYNSRKDLQDSFDLDTPHGVKNYNQWLTTHAISETCLGTIAKPIRRSWPIKSQTSNSNTFGVNLIGYAYGELGIGEDVRMAALALDAASVPFVIINIDPGANIRQQDRSVEKWVSEDPKYAFNVICLTALENLRIYIEQGSSLFSGRYNIGYWPWELHYWPKKWKHCFNLIDEVWASSKHIQRAAAAVSHISIRYMPMAVPRQSFNISKENVRIHYQLSQSDTIFIFSFDGKSHTERKNPSAIIEAFKLAFPNEERARLVIKCMRPDPSNQEWQQILAHSQTDKRIKIIDLTLSKTEVMGLYQSCDCYVSLHRAEGFGRGIAEALSLGLKVIATNYGGNVDFCKALNAKLIPYELIAVKPGDYVEAEDNFWAEPNINHAAEAMRIVHHEVQSASTDNSIEASPQLLDKIFSPLSVGLRYKEHLENTYRLIR